MKLTQTGPLRWRAGAGWLVLGGGGDWGANETSDIDTTALGWANLDWPMAVLPTAGGSVAEAEGLLEYYADLGGPRGYVVPIFDAAAAQLTESRQLLEQAGLIYISDGPETLRLVRALRESPALEAIGHAFERGAVVVGMGAGAAVLGAWIADPRYPERAEPGLGWMPDVIAAPHFKGSETADDLRKLLSLRQNVLGLGIPERVALALGPGGEVENVGPGQATVVVSGLEVSA